jgi:CBS domain-containing protein
MANRVAQILPGKRGKVWSVTPDTKVLHAMEAMASKDIGFLLVMEENQLIGVISERDIARKVVLNGKSPTDTSVQQIMCEKILVASTADTLEEAMVRMSNNHIRHLPVVEGAKVVGVISMGDVVKAFMGMQQETITFLEEMAME